jgi:hypothetical protein
MIIEKPGKLENYEWWTGKRMECPRCGQIIILEKDDWKNAPNFHNHYRPNCIAVACSNCDQHMVLERELPHE